MRWAEIITSIGPVGVECFDYTIKTYQLNSMPGTESLKRPREFRNLFFRMPSVAREKINKNSLRFEIDNNSKFFIMGESMERTNLLPQIGGWDLV